jgi:hypothetical protein
MSSGQFILPFVGSGALYTDAERGQHRAASISVALLHVSEASINQQHRPVAPRPLSQDATHASSQMFRQP